jgi:glycine/D-amino acid oxidase-like deaminating enzyme
MKYDVAVIGAGVFGAWTAWHLARAGKSVLLADAWGPGHSRSSSGGETRIIRLGYGADEIYTRMTNALARRSSTAQASSASRTTMMPTASLRAPRSRTPERHMKWYRPPNSHAAGRKCTSPFREPTDSSSPKAAC